MRNAEHDVLKGIAIATHLTNEAVVRDCRDFPTPN